MTIAMRLLLVEDDERLSSSLARGLRGEGYAVDVAGSGEEAIAQAQVYDYDVVILDVMLPTLDGVSYFRRPQPRLQSRRRWPPQREEGPFRWPPTNSRIRVSRWTINRNRPPADLVMR